VSRYITGSDLAALRDYENARGDVAVRIARTSAGSFLRQARACWQEATAEQRAAMVRLIRHKWRNHTARWMA
jgi:hypothetical protein